MSAVTAQELSQLGLFEGVDAADREKLAAMARHYDAQRGAILIEESAKGQEVFAIVSGRVEIHLSMPGGQESEVIAMLKEGDVVGESMLLGRTRRIASAVAKDHVQALVWKADQLQAYIETHPRVGYLVMRNLAGILQERLTATNMMLRNTFNRIVDIM